MMDHVESDRDKLFHEIATGSHLLPGENPESWEVEDAVLWIGVYQELVDITAKLLGTVHSEAGNRANSSSEAARTDLALIEAKRRRSRRRLGFWEGRARELEVSIIHRSRKPD